MTTDFLHNLLELYLDTAFWLLLGLMLAGVIKRWIPQSLVRRWLDGRGPGTVVRASLIGAPLPLCSCGVLPTAVGLHRAGASKPSTVSFLIATPETGVDSVALSYALLGPVLAVIRPVAAIVSAIVSGLLVLLLDRGHDEPATMPSPEPSCCEKGRSSCDAGHSHDAAHNETKEGFIHSLSDLVDDIAGWLAFGLVLAALVSTLIEPSALLEVGDSVWTLLLMLLVGLPLYICATASTPLAAAMLAAGLSPGAVLVFMLAGPATNIAALGVLSRELGTRTVVLYLIGICSSALLLGLATNLLFDTGQLHLPPLSASDSGEGSLFRVLQWISAVLLLLLAIRPLRRRLLPAEEPKSCCGS